MARLIAIDLGGHAVKVTVTQGSGRVHELEGEYRQVIPQDGTEAPQLTDRLAALDLLMRTHDELSGAHLAEVVWSSVEATSRRLELPFTDASQIEQTLPFVVEEEVPFELDDMAMGWRTTGAEGEVLVALAREESLRALIDALDGRDLDPRRVVTDGDLLGVFATYPDATTAVIDVGHLHTTVSIARGGEALSYRSISVAGRTFTRVIQEALGCAWGEAEALKHAAADEGEAPPDLEVTASGIEEEHTDPAFGNLPAKARDALNGALGLLLAEIRSTLIQAEDDLGREIDEVVLTGGGSRVPELRTYLEQDLGLSVRAPMDDAGPLAPEHALSRALSRHMAGDADGRVIDLRVGDLSFRGGMEMGRLLLTHGGLVLGFYLLAVFSMFGYRLYSLETEFSAVEGRIASVVGTSLEVEPPSDMSSGGLVSMMIDIVGEAQEEADFLGDGNAIPPMVDLLNHLTANFPAHPGVKVNVDTLDINPNAIMINGVTEGFAQVDSIQQSLLDGGRFREVVATPGNRNSKGKLNFTVNIDRTTDDDSSEEEEG